MLCSLSNLDISRREPCMENAWSRWGPSRCNLWQAEKEASGIRHKFLSSLAFTMFAVRVAELAKRSRSFAWMVDTLRGSEKTGCTWHLRRCDIIRQRSDAVFFATFMQDFPINRLDPNADGSGQCQVVFHAHENWGIRLSCFFVDLRHMAFYFIQFPCFRYEQSARNLRLWPTAKWKQWWSKNRRSCCAMQLHAASARDFSDTCERSNHEVFHWFLSFCNFLLGIDQLVCTSSWFELQKEENNRDPLPRRGKAFPVILDDGILLSSQNFQDHYSAALSADSCHVDASSFTTGWILVAITIQDGSWKGRCQFFLGVAKHVKRKVRFHFAQFARWQSRAATDNRLDITRLHFEAFCITWNKRSPLRC